MSKRNSEQTEARAKPLRKVNANKHHQNVKEHFANQANGKEPAAGTKSKENSSPLGFSKHYTSTTEILYSPFAAEVYNPPHLSSQQLYFLLTQLQERLQGRVQQLAGPSQLGPQVRLRPALRGQLVAIRGTASI